MNKELIGYIVIGILYLLFFWGIPINMANCNPQEAILFVGVFHGITIATGLVIFILKWCFS